MIDHANVVTLNWDFKKADVVCIDLTGPHCVSLVVLANRKAEGTAQTEQSAEHQTEESTG